MGKRIDRRALLRKGALLGAGAALPSSVWSGSGPDRLAVAGRRADPVAITVESATAVGRPWVGYGVQWDPYDGDTGVPITLTNAQWATITRRIDYLTPPIVRTVIEPLWFCPTLTLGAYTFESAMMRAWYRLLDYAQAHATDVMVGVWSSGPFGYTTLDFATAIADLLHYLRTERGYTTITYYNHINEPNYHTPTISYQDWAVATGRLATAFARRGLTAAVAIVGPDTSDADEWATRASADVTLRPLLGGYDLHRYPDQALDIVGGGQEVRLRAVIDAVARNDRAAKPFLLGEMAQAFGARGGLTDAQPHVVDFAYGLDMADFGVQAARAGVAAPIAWDLDDAMHSDQRRVRPSKVWGMWNSLAPTPTLRPWFYSWSLLAHFVPSGETLFRPQVAVSGLRVLAARAADPHQADRVYWTVVLVNRTRAALSTILSVPGAGSGTFDRYVYSPAARPADADGFPIPQGTLSGSLSRGLAVDVPATSLVLMTNLDRASVTSPRYHGRHTNHRGR